MSFRCL